MLAGSYAMERDTQSPRKWQTPSSTLLPKSPPIPQAWACTSIPRSLPPADPCPNNDGKRKIPGSAGQALLRIFFSLPDLRLWLSAGSLPPVPRRQAWLHRPQQYLQSVQGMPFLSVSAMSGRATLSASVNGRSLRKAYLLRASQFFGLLSRRILCRSYLLFSPFGIKGTPFPDALGIAQEIAAGLPGKVQLNTETLPDIGNRCP